MHGDDYYRPAFGSFLFSLRNYGPNTVSVTRLDLKNDDHAKAICF